MSVNTDRLGDTDPTFNGTVRYEVWAKSPDRGLRQVNPGSPGYLRKPDAQTQVDEHSAEEKENARMERRKIKTTFFVVEATTTRKVLS